MAKEAKERKRKDWRVTVLEWVEAIAAAVFLAMFARHFLIETFKIPTGSMQPTLWGERSSTDVYTTDPTLRGRYPERPSGGDKVLVNKMIYDFRRPERWDIVVFRFPQDTSLNYIKRLWGLPGETIQIREGDVWVDGAIVRKPLKIQNILWLRWFDMGHLAAATQQTASLPAAAGVASASRADALLRGKILQEWIERGYRAQQVDVRDGRLVLRGEQVAEPLELVYGPVVKDYRGYVMRDLSLDFDMQTTSPNGSLLVSLARDENRFRLELPLVGGTFTLHHGLEPVQAVHRVPSVVPLNDGRPHRVEFSNVDGAVRIVLDGRLLLEHLYEVRPAGGLPGDGSSNASFGVRQADVAFWNLRLRHDVHYTDPNDIPGIRERATYALDEPYRIPDGCYFFLGDNSGNSLDSRMWGAVPQRYLLGEAFFIFRPIQRWRFVN